MNILDELKRKNPDLPLFSVTDPEFIPYGRVLPCRDTAALSRAMEATGIPESGNRYVASEHALEALDEIAEIRRTVYGCMPIQAGFCNGRGYKLNAEEYHKCSEVNFTTTGLVLLLALPEDIHDCMLNSKEVKGFYLPPETLIEIHPRVLHFAPCRITNDGFNCLVVLERGTNAPLESVNTAAEGEEGLLWMQNKWLLCHPDSPQASKGAFIGITGENLTVKI